MPLDNRTYAKFRTNRLVNRMVDTLVPLQKSFVTAREIASGWQARHGYNPTWDSTRVALERWKNSLQQVEPPQKEGIALLAIRNRRWVEWTVYSACYLVTLGHRPTVVYSSSQIADLYGRPGTLQRQYSFWGGVTGLPHIEWINLDSFGDSDPAIAADYGDFIERTSHLLAAYDLKIEEYEPNQARPGEYEAAREQAKALLTRRVSQLVHLFESWTPERLVCPSGLIGASNAVLEVANRRGIDGLYVEAWSLRPGHLIWRENAPALEYDINGWRASIGEWTPEFEQDARDYIAFRSGEVVHREGWLDEFHQVQQAQKSGDFPNRIQAFIAGDEPIFLLGTNVVGDSSTLDRSTIFRSQEAWLAEVIAFFKGRPDLKLIIRAHPDELWVNARLRMGDIACTFLEDGNAANILVVSAGENVNSFALMNAANIGLAWVSTFGVDMTLQGKPVVVAARPKYTDQDIVFEPQTIEEYFALLLDLVKNPRFPSEDTMANAKWYQHIVFKEMTLEADSKDYDARNYDLQVEDPIKSRALFYRKIIGAELLP